MYSGRKRASSVSLVTLSKKARSVPVALAMKTQSMVKSRRAFRSEGGEGELKFLDTALSFTPDTTGEVVATGQINLVPQGDTESGRDGRKIVVKSIRIRGGVINIDNAASKLDAWMYLVLDRQCNGAAAAATDVLSSTNFGASLPNLANVERFQILKRWRVTCAPAAGVAASFANSSAAFDIYKKCNIPILFDNSVTTGAITSIRSNNLFLMCGSILGDDLWQVTGTSRIRFTDK